MCVCVCGRLCISRCIEGSVVERSESTYEHNEKGDVKFGESVVECIHARALAFAVSVVAAASIIGCWGEVRLKTWGRSRFQFVARADACTDVSGTDVAVHRHGVAAFECRRSST